MSEPDGIISRCHIAKILASNTITPISTSTKSADRGPIPKNCGISVQKGLFAPRVGVAYRAQPNTVVSAGYSLTPEQINMYRDGLYNYPLTVPQSLQGENSYTASTTLNQGFPALPIPDISSGIVPLPPTITVDSSPKKFIRGYTQSYNLSVQQPTRLESPRTGRLCWHSHNSSTYTLQRQLWFAGRKSGESTPEPTIWNHGAGNHHTAP
jgi:hypothetical protein